MADQSNYPQSVDELVTERHSEDDEDDMFSPGNDEEDADSGLIEGPSEDDEPLEVFDGIDPETFLPVQAPSQAQ
jgi:hypothetical protein